MNTAAPALSAGSVIERAGRTRARTLFLHAAILSGQVGAIIAAGFWLGAPVPVPALAGVLAFLFAASLLSWRAALRDRSPAGAPLALQLLADLAALTLLLYLSGGSTNPFVWLMLLSTTVAATLLPRWQAWSVAAAAIAAYSLLMRWFRPLPGMHMTGSSEFALHILGMWIGFLLSTVLIVHFVAGMAAAVRARDRELARAREQALRDERLLSLGALAASTAHELGTPLGTLTVLAGEAALDLDAGDRDATRRKLETMRGQLLRCREALFAMASSAGAGDARGGHATDLAVFVAATIDAWRVRHENVRVQCRINPAAPSVRVVAERSFASALVNLFDNAAHASPGEVEITADWNGDVLTIGVLDRGAGFAPGQAARIGSEPFTGRADGHGLGLYLSRGIIDRLGGRLAIRPRHGGGTAVEVRVPLAELRA